MLAHVPILRLCTMLDKEALGAGSSDLHDEQRLKHDATYNVPTCSNKAPPPCFIL